MNPTLRPARTDEADFAFEVKREAMGPHIRAKWGWDERFQRAHHARRWAEKPWFIICMEREAVGTVSLNWLPDHLQFGEFYLTSARRGQGLGSQILGSILAQADELGHESRLEFLKWNPVGRLYLRNGFKVVSESEIHYFAVRPPANNNSFKPTPLRGTA